MLAPDPVDLMLVGYPRLPRLYGLVGRRVSSAGEMAGFQISGGALGAERGSEECINLLDLPEELSHLMSGETKEGCCEGLSIDGTRVLCGGGDRKSSSGSSTISEATQFSDQLGLTRTGAWWFILKLPEFSRSPNIVLRTSGETKNFSAGRTDVLGAKAEGSLLGLGIVGRRSSVGLSEVVRLLRLILFMIFCCS